ncbi:MAG: hypothetical protein AAF604_14990 [Acidobacteriota bacterium]
MNRRRFLAATASTTALFLAGHSALGQGRRAPTYRGPEDPRILHLELETAAALEGLKRFYVDTLELAVVSESAAALTLQAGRSTLTFRAPTKGGSGGEPTYHFAFNIPENQIFEARRWQLERTPLLERPADAYSHADYVDVTDFWHWNAHSVFFEDPAGNLLEHIARHDLDNASQKPFSGKSLLYISEIGLVADDVPALGKAVQEATGLDLYYAGGDRFRAYGDPNGLVLGLQGGIPRWSDLAPWEAHKTVATLRDIRPYRGSEHPFRLSAPSESRNGPRQ